MKSIPQALCIAAMFFLAMFFLAAGCRGDTVENGSYGDAGAASDSGGTPLDGAAMKDGGSEDHWAGGDGAVSDGETAIDASPDATWDAGAAPDGGGPAEAGTCRPCEPGERSCDGLRVLSCVLLAGGCTDWSVEKTCTRFETCAEPAFECSLPETEPPGARKAGIAGASWGIGVESMLFDGTTALVSYGNAEGGSRYMGFLRFDAAGLVRPPAPATIDDQESSLSQAGGRTFVHWRDFGSHASFGELSAADAVAKTIGSDHNGMGQNVHSFGVGSGVLLYQTSVVGGSSAYLGFFDPETFTVSWGGEKPLFQWWTSTVAATESPGGFAAAWLTEDGTGLAFGRFSGNGLRVGAAEISALPATESSASALALFRNGEDHLLIWTSEEKVLHQSRFDSAGTLAADIVPDTGGLMLRSARFVGRSGSETLVSCRPDTAGGALVVLRIGSDGTLLGDRLVNSLGGIAAFVDGRLAVAWGVPDEGIGYAVMTFP
ncbi:MAG: hypothetical protein HY897_25605 [Deltaproteobacteria bacterium]|nr:hypothetical protein [Deltaproteobacteria bacterium]